MIEYKQVFLKTQKEKKKMKLPPTMQLQKEINALFK